MKRNTLFAKLKSVEFSLPIAGLITTTFLLMIIVGVLTYLNYNREKTLMQLSD